MSIEFNLNLALAQSGQNKYLNCIIKKKVKKTFKKSMILALFLKNMFLAPSLSLV